MEPNESPEIFEQKKKHLKIWHKNSRHCWEVGVGTDWEGIWGNFLGNDIFVGVCYTGKVHVSKLSKCTVKI